MKAMVQGSLGITLVTLLFQGIFLVSASNESELREPLLRASQAPSRVDLQGSLLRVQQVPLEDLPIDNEVSVFIQGAHDNQKEPSSEQRGRYRRHRKPSLTLVRRSPGSSLHGDDQGALVNYRHKGRGYTGRRMSLPAVFSSSRHFGYELRRGNAVLTSQNDCHRRSVSSSAVVGEASVNFSDDGKRWCEQLSVTHLDDAQLRAVVRLVPAENCAFVINTLSKWEKKIETFKREDLAKKARVLLLEAELRTRESTLATSQALLEERRNAIDRQANQIGELERGRRCVALQVFIIGATLASAVMGVLAKVGII